jgi:hypothetical protein
METRASIDATTAAMAEARMENCIKYSAENNVDVRIKTILKNIIIWDNSLNSIAFNIKRVFTIKRRIKYSIVALR